MQSYEECHQAGHGDHRGHAKGAMGDVWSILRLGGFLGTGYWAVLNSTCRKPLDLALLRLRIDSTDSQQAERLSLLALLIAQHLSEAAPHERVLLLGPYANVRPEPLSRAITLLGGKQATIYGIHGVLTHLCQELL